MKSGITEEQYRALAELRYQIRLFLQQGEILARSHGIAGQHYQVLLAIRGIQTERPCTIGALSERLLLKHHSTVELVDRLEASRLVVRVRDQQDRRQVFVKLQPRGERILEAIVRKRLHDLHIGGRTFVKTLHALVDKTTNSVRQSKTKRTRLAAQASNRVEQRAQLIAAD